MQSFEEDTLSLLKDKFEKKEISKRDFLKSCLIIGGGLAVSSLGVGKAMAQTRMTLANNGGDAIRVFSEAWTKPFEKASGIGVDIDGTSPLVGTVKKMVDDNNVHWDVFDGDGFYAPMLGGGYLEAIDYTVVNPNGFYDWNKFEFGAGSYVYSIVMAYDTNKLKTAPQNWVDFFDLEKFPGKRAMYKWFLGMPEACMMGAGKKPEDVYPIDMDLVFKMVESLGDNLVLWDTGAASQQLFLDEEIVMGTLWNTRATSLSRDTNNRVVWTWDQQIVVPGVFAIPKGARNAAAAQRFIAYTQDVKSQIKMLDLMGNGPANPAAVDFLTPAQAKLNPTSHLDKAVVRNEVWYAKNLDKELGNWLDAISG